MPTTHGPSPSAQAAVRAHSTASALKDPKFTEMSALNLESGTVTVKGEVFAVNNREIQKRGASVLSFDMTDYTGSIRVNKFFDKSEDAAVLGKIKPGQTLVVRGKITYNKFDNDMVLEPYNIVEGKAELRPDNAEGEARGAALPHPLFHARRAHGPGEGRTARRCLGSPGHSCD